MHPEVTVLELLLSMGQTLAKMVAAPGTLRDGPLR